MAISSHSFLLALDSPEQVQQNTWKRIFKLGIDTEYFRIHKLNSNSTIDDFRENIPICDWDAYSHRLEKIYQMESSYLCNEPFDRLVPTSGSSDSFKLIPYTQSLLQDFQRAIIPWYQDVSSKWQGCTQSKMYFALTPEKDLFKLPVLGNHSLQNRISFPNDLDYFGPEAKAIGSKLIIPEFDSSQNLFDVTAKRLFEDQNIVFLSIWHPSFMLKILECMPSTFSLSKNWPNLKCISAWADGSSEEPAKLLKQKMHGIEFQKKGLLATECVTSIPFYDKHPLAIESHFFEFMDEQKRVYLAHELELGQHYSVVVTTSGGLWRYNTQDVVEVNGFLKNTPSLKFIGREGIVSDLCGEKLNDSFVAMAIQKISWEKLPSARFLCPNFSKDAYILLHDGELSNSELEKLDSLIQENPHYHYCRKLNQLKKITANLVESNLCDKLFLWHQLQGQSVGQIKLNNLYTQSMEQELKLL